MTHCVTLWHYCSTSKVFIARQQLCFAVMVQCVYLCHPFVFSLAEDWQSYLSNLSCLSLSILISQSRMSMGCCAWLQHYLGEVKVEDVEWQIKLDDIIVEMRWAHILLVEFCVWHLMALRSYSLLLRWQKQFLFFQCKVLESWSSGSQEVRCLQHVSPPLTALWSCCCWKAFLLPPLKLLFIVCSVKRRKARDWEAIVLLCLGGTKTVGSWLSAWEYRGLWTRKKLRR